MSNGSPCVRHISLWRHYHALSTVPILHPLNSSSMSPLKHLACNLQQTSKWSKLSLGYRHLTSIPSTPGIQSLVPGKETCLNVNDDYEGVWCVPSATRISWIHRSQNKVLPIRACGPLFFDIYSSPICTKCLETRGDWSSKFITKLSSSSYICHGVGPLVDPFQSHVSRSLFKGLPWFLLPVGE